MPADTGFFAGRALVVSQVQTEYFVYVDDDFEFDSETKLEYLVERIENTGYDILGGKIGKRKMSKWARMDQIYTQQTKEVRRKIWKNLENLEKI